AVFLRLPVATPFHRHALDARGLLHGGCQRMIMRPGPADPAVDERYDVDGMAVAVGCPDVARVHGPGDAGGDVLALLLDGARALDHAEINRGYGDGAADDADQVRVDA